MYTPRDVKVISEAARNAALEEAAKVCDNAKCDHPGGMITAGSLARGIRRLKTTNAAPQAPSAARPGQTAEADGVASCAPGSQEPITGAPLSATSAVCSPAVAAPSVQELKHELDFQRQVNSNLRAHRAEIQEMLEASMDQVRALTEQYVKRYGENDDWRGPHCGTCYRHMKNVPCDGKHCPHRRR